MSISLPLLSPLDAVLVVVGIGLGLLLGYLVFPAVRRARRLGEELDRLRGEHEAYKAGVGEHFQKTAELVGEMTRSYAAVYDHLAGGARRFCGDSLADKGLEFGPRLALGAESADGSEGGSSHAVIETHAAAQETSAPASSDLSGHGWEIDSAAAADAAETTEAEDEPSAEPRTAAADS